MVDDALALPAGADAPLSPDSPEALAGEMRVDPLELEVAFDLVDLVDPSRGGDLLDRVRALRRKLALELGIITPLIRTRIVFPRQAISHSFHSPSGFSASVRSAR